jgi:hypothetical protein
VRREVALFFGRSGGSGDAKGGFDRAIISLPSGEQRSLTRREFEALPLDERVRAILSRSLKFYRSDKEVTMKEALGE